MEAGVGLASLRDLRKVVQNAAVAEPVTQSAPAVRVHEPDMDMSRRTEARSGGEGWYRRLAGALTLARPEGIIRRPKRSIDRDHQEFPFA
jgi:hypothetical protein